MTVEKTTRLAAKLAAVALEMKKVPKNGTNTNDHYKYAMAADVFEAVREHLAKQKVALIPAVDSNVSTIADRPKGVLATLWIDYTFVDGESDEKLVARIVSTAADYGMADKAVFKAETNALKYLLFQVFQISTGDDDVEKSSDEPKEAKPAARRAAAKAPADEPKPAPAAEVTVPITPEQTEDIRFLNAALDAKWTGKFLRQQLNALGAEKLIAALAEDHKKEHGVECPHYTNGADGAIVVKRG